MGALGAHRPAAHSGGARDRGRLLGGVPSRDIVRDQWHKLLWNAGFNAICAVTGATAGEALATPESERLVREAVARSSPSPPRTG